MVSDDKNSALDRIARQVQAYEARQSPPRIDLDRVQLELGKVVGAKVERLPEREHVHSYGFAIYFDDNFQPIHPELRRRSRFTAIVWVSWVAPFVAIQWRQNVTPREVITISEQKLPTQAREWSAKLGGSLVKLGYELLTGTILSEILPGEVSELDDSPASVFEVLFSAID